MLRFVGAYYGSPLQPETKWPDWVALLFHLIGVPHVAKDLQSALQAVGSLGLPLRDKAIRFRDAPRYHLGCGHPAHISVQHIECLP
jgi:hypothetical protein